MLKQIKITIETQADLPDIWFENGGGNDVAYYDFTEKCCIYDKIIEILQTRRKMCNGLPCDCPDGNGDNIDIEII